MFHNRETAPSLHLCHYSLHYPGSSEISRYISRVTKCPLTEHLGPEGILWLKFRPDYYYYGEIFFISPGPRVLTDSLRYARCFMIAFRSKNICFYILISFFTHIHSSLFSRFSHHCMNPTFWDASTLPPPHPEKGNSDFVISTQYGMER